MSNTYYDHEWLSFLADSSGIDTSIIFRLAKREKIDFETAIENLQKANKCGIRPSQFMSVLEESRIVKEIEYPDRKGATNNMRMFEAMNLM